MLAEGAFDQLNRIMGKAAPDSGKYTSVQSFVLLIANFFVVVALGLSVVALAFRVFADGYKCRRPQEC